MSSQENIDTIKSDSKLLKTQTIDITSNPRRLNPTKTYQGSYFFNKENKINKRELNRLKRLEKGKEIIRAISKRLTKQNSLFITGFDGEIRTPFKHGPIKFHEPRVKLKSDLNELHKFNVFETEDEFIRNIMYKLYIRDKKKKQSEKVKKREVLDKIYGFSPYHTQSIRRAKNKKYLPLKEYQDNILLTFANNYKSLDQGKFLDLVQTFKNIRTVTESISPLPKININTIRNHILLKGVKNLKKMSLKEYLLKNEGNLDEFEKENLLISKLKKQKYISPNSIKKRNKNFDILPQYLKDKFMNQLKYHG